jgi:hypothetical protein
MIIRMDGVFWMVGQCTMDGIFEECYAWRLGSIGNFDGDPNDNVIHFKASMLGNGRS